jgi:hypothetical protein
MGPPLGASPPKRMTASWPGALAGSTECKVAARLSRPLRGSPRFVLDTRLSNPAGHSLPPLWISGPPPPDSWRSLWRATYPQLPPLSICSRKGSHLEQTPLTENSPCKAQHEVVLVGSRPYTIALPSGGRLRVPAPRRPRVEHRRSLIGVTTSDILCKIQHLQYRSPRAFLVLERSSR